MKQQNSWRWKKIMALLLALATLVSPLGMAGAYATEGKPTFSGGSLPLGESALIDSGLPSAGEKAQPNIATPTAIQPFSLGDAPLLVSALVVDGGDAVELAFDKEMADPGSGAAGFAVYSWSGPTDKVVTAAQADGTKIKLTLDITVKGGEDLYLMYIPGGAEATDGGVLAAISYQPISNPLPHPFLATSNPPDGRVNIPYTHTFQLDTPGQPPNTFSSGGTLPGGLTLNSSTGVLSGTPTTAATYSFGIIVTDSGGNFDSRNFGMAVSAAAVCQIGTTLYTSLDDALSAVGNDEIIQLLTDIIDNDGLVIDNRKVFAIDVNGHILSVNDPTVGSGKGLYVCDLSDVDLTDSVGGGAFNATGTYAGVSVDNGTVTLTNATATGSYGYGVLVRNGGNVHITGTVQSAGMGGVSANGDGTSVWVGGDVVTTGASGYGAAASRGGEITVDGTVSVVEPNYYVNIEGNGKADIPANWSVLKPKAGYHTFTDGASTVWVKTVSYVAEIAGTKYQTLDAAITAVPAGGATSTTIKLLGNISQDTPLEINNKKITFDLNDYDLTIDTSATNGSTALTVTGGGKVGYTGSTDFKCIGNTTAVDARGDGSEAVISYAETTRDSSYGVCASECGKVAVKGNVLSRGEGDYAVYAVTGGDVTVEGSVTACSIGVYSNEMFGSVGSGVVVQQGVTVTSPDSTAVIARNGGKAEITGNITAGERGVDIAGYIAKPSEVIITGNVTVTGDVTRTNHDIAGVAVGGYSNALINGSVHVSGDDCTGVFSNASTVRITGDVQSAAVGAMASNSGTITIDGQLTAAGAYVLVGGVAKSAADFEVQSSWPGYREYKNGGNKVWVKEPSASSLTVQGGIGGGSYLPGATVTITANTPASGQRFKEWSIAPSVTLVEGTAATSSTAKFIMPALPVSATAVFAPIPAAAYAVTVNGSYAGATGSGSYAPGSVVTVHAGSRGNYSFTGWISPDGVTFASVGSATTTFTMPAQNVSVTANWSYNGGGSSGGGGYAPPPAPIATEKQPNMPTTAKMSVPGTVKDNTLSATITEQMAKDAINAAQDAAKKSGKEADGIALDFNITGSGNSTNLNVIIDAVAIDRLKEAGVKFVKIGSAVLDITFDTGALAQIGRQSRGIVTVSATRLTKLSDAAKKRIGNRPVFDITVSYRKNGKTKYVTNFGKGRVTLGIAYKATDGEDTGSLFGVYVNKKGKPQFLNSSSYNNGRVIFSRNSLSTYGVGYKPPSPASTDTAKH